MNVALIISLAGRIAGFQDNSHPLTTNKQSDKQEATALRSAYGNYSSEYICFSVSWVCVGEMWSHCLCVQGDFPILFLLHHVQTGNEKGLMMGRKWEIRRPRRSESGAAGKLASAIRYCSLVTNLKWKMTEMEIIPPGVGVFEKEQRSSTLPVRLSPCRKPPLKPSTVCQAKPSQANPATSSVVFICSWDPRLRGCRSCLQKGEWERVPPLFGSKNFSVAHPDHLVWV